MANILYDNNGDLFVAGGDVATDAIWDAAGDLAVGTGADTAGRLAIGTTGQIPTIAGGTVAWTSFGTITIAASDSSAQAKAMALSSGGVVCTDTNDEVDFAATIVSGHDYFVAAGGYSFDAVCTLSALTDVNIYFEAGSAIVRDVNAFMFAITGCTNVHIYGGDFSQADANNTRLVEITASTNTWFIGSHFHDFVEGIRVICNTGTHAKSIGTRIDNCEFEDFTYAAIITSDGVDWTWITNNKIHDQTTGVGGIAYGITTGSTGAADATVPGFNHLFITGNIIYSIAVHNGIDAHGGNYLTISDNQIYDIASTAIYAHNAGTTSIDGERWTIKDNIIHDVVIGIMVSNSEAGTVIRIINVHDNEITEFTSSGVKVYVDTNDGSLMTDIAVHDNILQSTTGTGSTNAITFAGRVADVASNLRWKASNNIINGYGAGDTVEMGIRVDNLHYVNLLNNNIARCNWGMYLNNTNYAIVDGGRIDALSNGLNGNDGDWMTIKNLTFHGCVTCTIDINDAKIALCLITGINQYGCTNEMITTNAVTPRIFNNIGKAGTQYITSGEITTISFPITAGVENVVSSIINNFGGNVFILESNVAITTAASATNPTYDAGIDADGAGAPDGAALFTAIPDTVGYYSSLSNGRGGAASGVQTDPVLWAVGAYVNFIILAAAGADTAGRVTITVMGV